MQPQQADAAPFGVHYRQHRDLRRTVFHQLKGAVGQLVRHYRDRVARHESFGKQVPQLSRVALLDSAPEITVSDDAREDFPVAHNVNGPQPSSRNRTDYFQPGSYR